MAECWVTPRSGGGVISGLDENKRVAGGWEVICRSDIHQICGIAAGTGQFTPRAGRSAGARKTTLSTLLECNSTLFVSAAATASVVTCCKSRS